MAPVLEVVEVFRRHGEAYRQPHAGHLGRVERRVIGAIEPCRRRRLAAMSSIVRTAGWSVSPTTPAATGIARSARAWPAPSGWRAASRVAVGTVPPCPVHRLGRGGRDRLPEQGDSLCVVAFCTPGGITGIITPTSIASFLEADCRSMERVGWPAGQTTPRQAQGDDPGRRRVHPPLPLAYPAGPIHRIRHYGFLANGDRRAKLAHCRQLLAAPSPAPPAPADYRERNRQLTGVSLDICPCCSGAMLPIGPLARPARQNTPSWFDTS